jgi:hypothetical protein
MQQIIHRTSDAARADPEVDEPPGEYHALQKIASFETLKATYERGEFSRVALWCLPC